MSSNSHFLSLMSLAKGSRRAMGSQRKTECMETKIAVAAHLFGVLKSSRLIQMHAVGFGEVSRGCGWGG